MKSAFITSHTLGNDFGVRLPDVYAARVVLPRGPRRRDRRRLARRGRRPAAHARAHDARPRVTAQPARPRDSRGARHDLTTGLGHRARPRRAAPGSVTIRGVAGTVRNRMHVRAADRPARKTEALVARRWAWPVPEDGVSPPPPPAPGALRAELAAPGRPPRRRPRMGSRRVRSRQWPARLAALAAVGAHAARQLLDVRRRGRRRLRGHPTASALRSPRPAPSSWRGAPPRS